MPEIVCTGCPPGGKTQARDPSAMALSLGVTSLVGGVVAGVRRTAVGDSFQRAFLRGAAGGAVNFAGKRLSGEHWFGAGFLGREVAAVGASMVLNASEGRAPLELLVLPAGPVRVHLRPGEPAAARLKLDVAAMGALLLMGRDAERLDGRSTLSAATPVFTMGDGTARHAGRHVAGVIELRPAADESRAATLAHEQVHVLQSDFFSTIVSLPLESALFRRLGLERMTRHLDFGAHHLFRAAVIHWVDYESDPWEWEARALSGTGR